MNVTVIMIFSFVHEFDRDHDIVFDHEHCTDDDIQLIDSWCVPQRLSATKWLKQRQFGRQILPTVSSLPLV